MSGLILDSLEVRGFRGFLHLQIERLGRVNLIVGKNNVGKTSLLEALLLYTHEAYPPFIWNLLRVFATTHSGDCIGAFQKAALEDTHEEGMLVRLENKNDGIGATLFDERRLGIATREQIEVR